MSSANVKKLGKNSNFNEKIEQEQPEYLEEPSLQDQVKLLLGTDTLVKPKQESFTSLHLLLQQAITSGDLQMLEKALQITDRKIIHNTVRKLEPQVVVELIDQLVTRLQKNANRGLMMIEWVKSCLVHHSAYLLTVINFNEVPQLTQKLGALYRGLENRQETFGRLLRLKGRLDMVCLQERYVDAEDEEVIVFDANGDASESEQDMQDIDSEYDYESEFDGIMLE